MVGVPFAASRVFDELASLAFDTAPGTRRRKCGQKSLDRADDVIDGAEFLNELATRDARNRGVAGGSKSRKWKDESRIVVDEDGSSG